MFSPAQEQQIYRTSRYLLGLLQPRLDRACRLQVRTWLAEALEQGAFVSEAEEIHTIPNFIVQLEVACLIHRELGLKRPFDPRCTLIYTLLLWAHLTQ